MAIWHYKLGLTDFFPLTAPHSIKHRGILGLLADAKQANVYIAEVLGLAVTVKD